MIINCLVVDDEPIARKGLLEHIAQVDFLNPVAEHKNAVEALSSLRDNEIDLLFLDIEMPAVSGIDFARNLSGDPLVVFTTAYPQYALEGYELNVFDYLLKPVSFSRFFKTAQKAHDYLLMKTGLGNRAGANYFFVKCGQKIERIVFDDILYIEGLSNYLTIHTRHKKHVAYLTLKNMEGQLPAGSFVRIHKSFIISIAAIQSIDGAEVAIDGRTLPVGKNYRERVMAAIERRMFYR